MKKVLTLLILCLLLAGGILLYVFMPQNETNTEETETAEETDDSITVDQISEDDITAVEVKKDKEVVCSLQKKGKNWKNTADKKLPIDSEQVSSMLACLNPVEASKELKTSDGTETEYGLDKPAMTIKVTAGGATYEYLIGDTVPVEGGYYAKKNGTDTIYCLSEELYQAFDVEINTLVKMEELPEMETDYMTYISVENKKGDSFEAKAVSKKEQVDSYTNWNITKPYAKPLAASTQNWNTALGYFNALSFEELVDYNSDNLKKYGLSSPSSVITVTYYEAKEGYTPTQTQEPSDTGTSEQSYVIPENKREYHTLTLLIGKKTGDFYYVCEKNSANVYTMSEDVVNNMIAIDAYDCMDHCVYSTLATVLDGYEVTYGDTTLKITRTPDEEEKDTDSGSVNNNIWKLNGKVIADEDEEAFLTPYSSAYLLEFTAKAKDSVKPKSTKPVLSFVYHETDRDVKVEYLPYDGTNFYRVNKDGMDYFLVDKMAVDTVIERFKGIEKYAGK